MLAELDISDFGDAGFLHLLPGKMALLREIMFEGCLDEVPEFAYENEMFGPDGLATGLIAAAKENMARAWERCSLESVDFQCQCESVKCILQYCYLLCWCTVCSLKKKWLLMIPWSASFYSI